MIINSTNNETVKKLAMLKTKKYRDEYGLYLVEGENAVEDTLKSVDNAEVAYFVLDKTLSEDISGYEKLFGGERLIVADSFVLDKISSIESGCRKILVLKKRKAYLISNSRPFILMDRVRDPGNVGAILRTATAAGYGVIHRDCADIYNPKVIRSAVSAVVKAEIHEYSSDIRDMLKNSGYHFIGADTRGKDLFMVKPGDIPAKHCVIIGNEGHGISTEMRESCDGFICIPMQEMESLNASVSAGIIMYTLKYMK